VKRDRRIKAKWQADPLQPLEIRNHYFYPPKKTPEPGPSNSIFAAIFRELHYRYKATEITKEIDKEIMKEIAKVIGIPKDKL
jgi:hypothetical protein